LADLQLRQGKWDAAEILLAEAEQLALDTETKYPLVYLYAYRAQVCLGKRQLDVALEMAERSCALAREMKLKAEQGNSLRVLGQVLQASGRTAEALDVFEKSLALLDSAPYEAARTKLQWGLALRSIGNMERGMALLQEARAAFSQLGARRELADVSSLLTHNAK
jgi:tetratricopeptide (TPR) repeat protein